jgi:hypothetical protein
MTTILIPVSPGELLDKISILEIKEARIQDEVKRSAVKNELALLRVESAKLPQSVELSALYAELREANEEVWDGEEVIRAEWGSDEKFLAASRVSHAGNDKRFQIKKKINDLLGSDVNEVKSHQA